nr:carbamoyl-phosphate synthase (glutamine-hydrolyzing) cpa2 [Polyrhizophydium stewartii]
MKLLGLVSAVLALAAPLAAAPSQSETPGRARFDGHQLWNVAVRTQEQVAAVEQLQEERLVDIWGAAARGEPLLVRVTPDARAAVRSALAALGLDAEVVSEDVQAMVDAQVADDDRSDPSDPSESGAGAHRGGQVVLGVPARGRAAASFFSKYHTIEELHAYYDDLAERFPGLVAPFEIGKTFQGRTIKGIHITGNGTAASKREIVFHGGMHAREWIGPAVVTYIATQLVEQYGHDEAVTQMLDTFEFSILPVLNVDGFVYTHTNDRMWRKTRQPSGRFGGCVGTDPNRNWAYKWGTGGSSTNPCSDAYMGPRPFSEPESKAMADYVHSHAPNVVSYIDFHAFSQLWMFPYGGECGRRVADYDKLMRAGKAAAKAIKATHGMSFEVGPICEVIYQASGSSVDHVYAMSNVTYAYAVELRDTGRYGFLLPPKYIVPSGEETFAAVKAMVQQIAKEEQL